MSYRVDYSPETKKRYPIHLKMRRKLPVLPLVISIVAIGVCYGIFSSGLLRLLIPGDTTVTTAAFSTMVEEIETGESVRQAVLSFCKEIIVNAN